MIRLADVFRQFLPDYDALHPRSAQAHKVCQQIEACRTPALGGFQLHCANCDEDGFLYHACRNRHCPRCQHKVSEAWEQGRLADVVDAPYFHLVFTLPHELNSWARLHPSAIYHALFQSVWDTVNTLGQDKKRLSGQLGMTAVLHTWGQNLSQHIHLHCLIPGGALGTDGHWHPAKSNYLFPVRVLSRLFRGKMVAALRSCYDKGSLPRLTYNRSCNNTLNELMNKEWVVYARHCLNQPETVVGYLSRYTRKIALSESRLMSMDDNTVSFRYQDYRDNQKKVLTLTGTEFIRRFLQHVLPHGFMRIRHYGWLSNASRAKQLPSVRQAIANHHEPDEAGSPSADSTTKDASASSLPAEAAEPFQGIPCCHCQQGIMRIVGLLRPVKAELGLMAN